MSRLRIAVLASALLCGTARAAPPSGAPMSVPSFCPPQACPPRGVEAASRQGKFARIAVERDYRDEYVLFRDDTVTAFLDWSDSRHPRHRDGDATAAHILVVPNTPRYHVGKTWDAPITLEDLEVASKVMRAAEALGRRLHLRNARTYINSPEVIEIGYLHVHLVGERDPAFPYPAALTK